MLKKVKRVVVLAFIFVMLFSISSNANSSYNLMGDFLIKLEKNISNNFYTNYWRSRRRSQWYSEVKANARNIYKFKKLILDFEVNLYWTSQLPHWKRERSAWMNKVYLSSTYRALVQNILKFEKVILKKAFKSGWAARRNNWINLSNKILSLQYISSEPNLLLVVDAHTSQENAFSVDRYTRKVVPHTPYTAFDNDVKTAWVVNKNRGIGGWLRMLFYKKTKIYKIGIRPGYDYVDPRYGDLFMKNNHLKKIIIIFYADKNYRRRVYSKFLTFDGTRGMKYFSIPKISAYTMKLVVLNVYTGTKYVKDTCISEIKVFGK